jgi:hypothetical protein
VAGEETVKLTITFKDPDGVFECVREGVRESLPDGLAEDERDELLGSRTEAAHAALKQWIQWKEYLTVEFDTEAGTATVVGA